MTGRIAMKGEDDVFSGNQCEGMSRLAPASSLPPCCNALCIVAFRFVLPCGESYRVPGGGLASAGAVTSGPSYQLYACSRGLAQ